MKQINFSDYPIPVEVSAHHVHLSREHVEALFGKDARLTPVKELSQPGQFAADEKVTLVGPKGKVERVRVLGPERKETQVEISKTEQYTLGIQPPIRDSGNVAGTPGIMLEGPAGSVELDHGVIAALRHIHMTPDDAKNLGLKNYDVVQVRISGDRELIYGDVLIRVNESYRLVMHIDTDEGNAANAGPATIAYIVKIQEGADEL
ncbi:MAG: phosphate propanoyltransferase [Spirochaetales bacterium]|nr:phosphate propanoyltransferase [Spirochaetales bacterium]